MRTKNKMGQKCIKSLLICIYLFFFILYTVMKWNTCDNVILLFIRLKTLSPLLNLPKIFLRNYK